MPRVCVETVKGTPRDWRLQFLKLQVKALLPAWFRFFRNFWWSISYKACCPHVGNRNPTYQTLNFQGPSMAISSHSRATNSVSVCPPSRMTPMFSHELVNRICCHYCNPKKAAEIHQKSPMCLQVASPNCFPTVSSSCWLILGVPPLCDPKVSLTGSCLQPSTKIPSVSWHDCPVE